MTLAALALLAAPAALASGGDYEPQDELVSRFAPDYDRDQVLHGHVGIVLPSWDRASQYLAWRAIVTGGKAPAGTKPATRAASDVPAGWRDAAQPAPTAIGGVDIPTINANSPFDRATVRYYLADQLAASGQADAARAMSDGLLARLKSSKPLSGSAVNLVTQQRFGFAPSVADASPYLLMVPDAAINADTGERADPAAGALAPSDDGLRWLDRSLSVADLLTLARG